MFCSVRLVTDKYADEGALRGMVGSVIEDYGGHYEVEFSDPATGFTLAQVVVVEAEVEEVPQDGSRTE